MTEFRTRDVVLEGAYNFRDIGGYSSEDGSMVRCGLVYRSASLATLTLGDLTVLSSIGVRQVVDLRTNVERAHRPGRMTVATWARDYNASGGDLIEALTDPATTPERCRELMCATYDNLPEEQAESYAELFRMIAAGTFPLVFHCAVGKDRTGVAAALLLTFLGVPREVVQSDYLDTARVADRLIMDTRASLEQNGSLPISDTLLRPILSVDPEYLAAMFTGLRTRYGSVDGYVEQRLGLSQSDVRTIREKLLEP